MPVLTIALVVLSGAACGSTAVDEPPIDLPERRYAEDASASATAAPPDVSPPLGGGDAAAPAPPSAGTMCASSSGPPSWIGQSLEQGALQLRYVAPWENAGDVAALDGLSASVSMENERPMSSVLVADHFALTIPAGATITGVEVVVTRETSAKVRDRRVQLSYKGAAIGKDFADPNQWLPGTVTAVYGADNDPWGAALDRATVIDPSFGVHFGVYNEGASSVARVDGIELTVHYCR